MKQLSKEYGYAALAVYFALSALDFPFCFLGVRLVGTEKIGQYEEVIIGAVKPWWVGVRAKVGFPLKEPSLEEKIVAAEEKVEAEREAEERKREGKGASRSSLCLVLRKGGMG